MTGKYRESQKGSIYIYMAVCRHSVARHMGHDIYPTTNNKWYRNWTTNLFKSWPACGDQVGLTPKRHLRPNSARQISCMAWKLSRQNFQDFFKVRLCFCHSAGLPKPDWPQKLKTDTRAHMYTNWTLTLTPTHARNITMLPHTWHKPNMCKWLRHQTHRRHASHAIRTSKWGSFSNYRAATTIRPSPLPAKPCRLQKHAWTSAWLCLSV